MSRDLGRLMAHGAQSSPPTGTPANPDRFSDFLLAFVFCHRGIGPPPAEGALHRATQDWRPECGHCWGVALLGASFWLIPILVLIVTSR